MESPNLNIAPNPHCLERQLCRWSERWENEWNASVVRASEDPTCRSRSQLFVRTLGTSRNQYKRPPVLTTLRWWFCRVERMDGKIKISLPLWRRDIKARCFCSHFCPSPWGLAPAGSRTKPSHSVAPSNKMNKTSEKKNSVPAIFSYPLRRLHVVRPNARFNF